MALSVALFSALYQSPDRNFSGQRVGVGVEEGQKGAEAVAGMGPRDGSSDLSSVS